MRSNVNISEQIISHRIMYVTESPCVECAAYIVAYGVSQVYYFHEYRIKDGIDLLVSADVSVFRMTPGGYIINYATDELVHGG